MRYADLGHLRTHLLALSDEEARSDRELLKAAHLGVRAFRDPMVAQFIAKIASRLYHSPSDPVVRGLCRGALVSALRNDGPPREQLPFALRLIRRAAATQSMPVAIPISDPMKELAANQLARHSQAPAKFDRLARAVRDFATQNAPIAGGVLFARLLADLEFLNARLGSRDCSDEHRQIAAGALTYFVETNDAIDDELGIIGMLDDAYVLQLAAEQIEPVRRVKTALVDALLGQWPFLGSLRLSIDGKDWIPSEFVLVNAAVAFGPESASKNAIVLPSTDDMPLVLAVLAALGALHDAVERRDVPFRPAIGDQICLSGDDGALCEVVRYLPTATSTHDADPSDAHFVTLRYLPRARRAGAAVLTNTRRIDILDGCRPAPGERVRRRTSLPSNADDAAIGPLEQVFSLDRPARFSRNGRSLIVVGSIGPARSFLRSTTLFDRTLEELLPCGTVSRDDDYRIEWWSASRGLDVPVLTVVRDLAEAAAIVARRAANSSPWVVSAIDADDWDATSLRAVEGDVVAVVPQRRGETQDSLRADGFKFLDWTPELARAIARRPRVAKPTPIDAYETRVRRELLAEVRVHAVELDSMETSFASLKEFSKTTADEYGDDVPDRLSSWASEASALGFGLASQPVAVREARASDVDAKLRALSDGLDASGASWSDPCRAAARRHLDELRRATTDLKRANPKASVLAELMRTNGLTVRCSNRAWEALRSEHPRASRWSRLIAYGPVALFEWPGAERMGRLLLPPLGDPTHVVFYRWERERFATVERRRESQLRAHWRNGVRHAGWHLDDVPVRAVHDPRADHTVSAPAIEVDAWLAGLERHRVMSRATRAASGEQMVHAIPVMFGASKYAFYEPDADVLIATHLLQVDVKRRDDASLQPKLARQLRTGDIVVNVQGSSRDAIRELADKNLPPGARDLARTWQPPLRELRARAGSDRAVWERLRAAGCGKQEATVQEWLRSKRQIGPSDEHDLDAIAQASADASFSSRLTACKEAIRRVRGEHIRASHALATRAIEALAHQLQNSDDLGAGLALGDQVELLTVQSIGDTFVRVPASSTGIVEVLP